MRQKILMGNWKMNGNRDKIASRLSVLVDAMVNLNDIECAVFPPAIYLPLVYEQLKESSIAWGAQNVYPHDFGAYTGEISAPMLIEYGCKYVLVGHSERRHLFHENENFVAEKFHHVKDRGMIPVLCVGETQKERENGLTKQVLHRQLQVAIEKDSASCIIAYEPVWAIGTGQTATPEQAQEIHAFIRALLAEFDQEQALRTPVLYGGSVNEKNARALFSMPDIDGGLVGGASLNAEQFVEIMKCIN